MPDLFQVILVVVLVMHGISHLVWFLPAWTSRGAGFGEGSWLLPGEITIRGRAGKVFGLVALVVSIMFIGCALGLLAGMAWWASWAQFAVFLSFGVVLPWYREAPRSMASTAVVTDIVLMFILATSDILGLPFPVVEA